MTKPTNNPNFASRGQAWRLGFETGHKEGCAETLKATGNCKRCYGKGYGTRTAFAHASRDFEGDQEYVWQLPELVFCKCGRGKQLRGVFEKLLASAESMSTAREVRYLIKDILLNQF